MGFFEKRKKKEQEYSMKERRNLCNGIFEYAVKLRCAVNDNEVWNAAFGINLAMEPTPGSKPEDYLPDDVIAGVKEVKEARQQLNAALDHLIMVAQMAREQEVK